MKKKERNSQKINYYIKQIQGLMLILNQNDADNNSMVSRNYIFEKLKMILNGGINFHPSILEKLT